MSRRGRLELTWVGKEERPRLEPRILLEDAAHSYHAARRVSEADRFDNMLIQGDNLLALKALEQNFAGKVKCVFIDPPYNTGSAFEHYDDGIEHSLWLTMMRDRLELLRTLLAEDGSIWITIDDNEAHYLKVLCDEIFGRENFVGNVVWRSSDNSNNDAKQFSIDHNHLLVYSREPEWRTVRLPPSEQQRRHFKNPDNDPRGPWFDGNPLSSPNPRPNLQYDVISPTGKSISPPTNGWRWSRETMATMIAAGEIRFTPEGTAIRRRTYLREMGGVPPSSLWAELEETGHNRQAKYEQKALFPDLGKADLFATPKPERLVHRALHIATRPGDLVLDSFLGSGTTAAVAHKMGRRWIGIELGEHAVTHCVPRLRKVVDGTDPGGVTESTGWKGGGGFRFYRLAPSLLERDAFGQWVISEQYNPAMLAEAVCKLEGFRYEPSPIHYWQHGRSTENDFIYVTTQTLTHEQLRALSMAVGAGRTLLVCCAAYQGRADAFENLEVKRMPHAVLGRCEWGRDDYSLQVAALPPAAPAAKPATPGPSAEATATAKGTRGRARSAPVNQMGLFESAGETGDGDDGNGGRDGGQP
ncbi:site-specific DNA-methyltransferase [Myxococcota bacterium]|nr:site-specific DNA-methyltransferase [Myxococcota bacterium]